MSGHVLVGVVGLITTVDILIARVFLHMANRAESEVGSMPHLAATNPQAMRRVAHILIFTAPVAFIIAAVLSFGIIPIDAIVPIKF